MLWTNLGGSDDGWSVLRSDAFGEEIQYARPSGLGTEPGTWMKISLVSWGPNFKILRNDAPFVPAEGWQYVGERMSPGSVWLSGWSVPPGESWWIDDVRVRRFVSPEPAVVVGNEESAPR